MNTKFTKNEIDIVMNALAGTPIVTTPQFADKIQKVLTKYDELKEAYIKEKLTRYKLIVPNGNCPYVYFNFDNGIECGEFDCNKCKYKFFQDIEKEIRRLADEQF